MRLPQLAPRDLRALAREMRQIFPQCPTDSAVLKKLRADNRAKFEDWQRRQLPAVAT